LARFLALTNWQKVSRQLAKYHDQISILGATYSDRMNHDVYFGRPSIVMSAHAYEWHTDRAIRLK